MNMEETSRKRTARLETFVTSSHQEEDDPGETHQQPGLEVARVQIAIPILIRINREYAASLRTNLSERNAKPYRNTR